MAIRHALLGRLSLASLLLVTACGSTAQIHSSVTVGGDASNGFGAAPGTTGGQGGPSTTSGGTGAGSGLAPGSSGGSGGQASTGLVGGGSTGGASGTTGGGSTGQGRPIAPGGQVKIGYLYSSDQAAVAQQFGAKGVVAGDTNAQYQAIAADINHQGGVLGHPLKLIGHDISTANELNNPQGEEEKACADFVQDQHVFAVLQGGPFLSPCLAKAGVPTVNGGQFDDPKTMGKQLIYDGGGMLSPVLAKAFVDRLAAQHYFTGWDTTLGKPGLAPVKVGLIYQDLPLTRSYYADIKKQLAAHGFAVSPSDEFIYSPRADGVASQSQAAVLKFAQDGVTHVFGAALLFFEDAYSQQYHPRYGLDSIAPPALLEGNVDPTQLHGALGIGWRPTWDVNAPSDPGPVSVLATRCSKLMRDAGQDLSARTVVYLVHVECEQVWSLKGAFEKGGAVTLAAMKAGFDALGSPTPVVSFGERWAPDRHASNTTVADLAYLDRCNCFAYTAARTSF